MSPKILCHCEVGDLYLFWWTKNVAFSSSQRWIWKIQDNCYLERAHSIQIDRHDDKIISISWGWLSSFARQIAGLAQVLLIVNSACIAIYLQNYYCPCSTPSTVMASTGVTGPEKMVCKTYLRRTQAGPSRRVMEQQEGISPNHLQAIFGLCRLCDKFCSLTVYIVEGKKQAERER